MVHCHAVVQRKRREKGIEVPRQLPVQKEMLDPGKHIHTSSSIITGFVLTCPAQQNFYL